MKLDSVTLRRLYPEALDLCDAWSTALREGPTGDELGATEAAVLGFFDPEDPADVGARRLDLADLVRQLTELLALDRWGLLASAWLYDEVPSLGWPAVLAQAQYRLRQIAAAVGPRSDRVPLGGGELRRLFPELVRLLACYHETRAHGDLGAYLEPRNPDVLPNLVVRARLEASDEPGRSAASLSGELAAFGVLFAGEDEVDRALALLGEEPRGTRPATSGGTI